MATVAWRVKQRRQPKFRTRRYNRCQNCGRRHGFIRRFQLCRLCFRELAHQGKIPGVIKSSW
ncbi:MAG: type Z 30S ribosomal protein S14 [Verrucomicrobiae bacterium]|nr:type Z 30S ribosomal protein S14 [Verrucomicrobiae bacterium]